MSNRNINDKKRNILPVYVLCLVLRVLCVVLFQAYSIMPLFIYDVVGCVIYGVGIILIRNMGRKRFFLYLFLIEITIFTVLHNMIVGWGMGFSLYGLVLTVLFFYLRYEGSEGEVSVKTVVIESVTSYAIIMVSNFIGPGYDPIDAIPVDVVQSVHTVNTLICFVVIIVICAKYYNLVVKKEGELRVKNSVLEDVAYNDQLTGCYNRSGFYMAASKLMKENPDVKYCIVCSDIMDFKLINDLFGEEYGDRVLKMQVKLCNHVMKDGAVLGRIAGDRFAMCLPKDRFSEEVFLNNVNMMKNRYSSNRYRLYIQIGVYEVEDINEPVGKMCDRVFYAISRIKGDLNTVITYYNREVVEDSVEKQLFLSNLDEALLDNQIQMYLQPQTDKNGNVFGAEALVRWIHPEKGIIPPFKYIEFFEKVGVIYKLDVCIWRQAAEQLKKWKEAGIDYYISVNISQKDFYYLDVHQTISSIAEEYGIDKSKLRLEITESTFSEQQGEVKRAIELLHDEGFIIEIDDFGSGYSSLRFLKDVCADVVKIDRGFLQESSDATRSKSILQSIIGLTHDIGMSVVAEGVETIEQIEMVDSMGCECYQGFYFSRPIPIVEFENKYIE